jgi:hypothetical protein
MLSEIFNLYRPKFKKLIIQFVSEKIYQTSENIL